MITLPPNVWLAVAVGAAGVAAFAAVWFCAGPFGDRLSAAWRGYLAWVDGELRALYWPMRARAFAARHLACVAAGLVLGRLASGPGLAVACAAAGAAAPVLWLGRARAQRRKALDAQLDATLQSIANTIAVTQNLEDAFGAIAQHFAPPISQEADVLVKQVRLGTPLEHALRDLAERCQSRHVDAMVTALTIGLRTGGKLPEVLDKTAQVLREILRIEGMLAAKTSEGKAQSWVIGLVPLVFAAALHVVDPLWMKPLFDDPIGWIILVVVCLLEGTGIALTIKLTRINV